MDQRLLLDLVFVGYIVATVAYLGLIFKQNLSLARFGRGVLVGTLFVHTVLILLRVKADHDFMGYWYAPVANIFEEAMCLGWAMTLVYLIAEARTNFKALGILVVPLIALLTGWGAFGLDQSVTPPPPALQSYWINIHVPMHLGAYASFTIAFGLALFFFMKNKQEQRMAQAGSDELDVAEEGPSSSGGVAVAERVSVRLPRTAPKPAAASGLLSLVPGTEVLDKMMYRTVIIGFGFLTALIMLGAVWAEESWGKYWSWDPKETAGLITWMVYAVYLHGRFTWGAKRRYTMAVLCVVGFLATIFTYLGVGFLLPGLHSYLKG